MGKEIVIICDGAFPKKEYPRYLIRTADFIICCDGALRKFLRNSKAIFGAERLPDKVIGDMDSLSPAMKARYGDLIVTIDEQENNDQTKAFTWALENIGATGEREDHTIGNISLLMEYARTYRPQDRGIDVQMISDHATIFAITGTFEMECGEGRKVSIFSPDNSLRITSEGLKFQTCNVVFDNWWQATLNLAVKDRVRLELSHPSIALVMLN